MSSVKAEGDGGAVFGAEATVGAEDEDLGAEDVGRVPAHADIHTKTEEIAGGLGEEHLGGDGENAGGAGRVCRDGGECEVGAFENGGERDFLNDGCSCIGCC